MPSAKMQYVGGLRPPGSPLLTSKQRYNYQQAVKAENLSRQQYKTQELAKIESQREAISKERQKIAAYEYAQQAISRSGGVTRGSDIGAIKQKFAEAGLDPEAGAQMYIQGATTTGSAAPRITEFVENNVMYAAGADPTKDAPIWVAPGSLIESDYRKTLNIAPSGEVIGYKPAEIKFEAPAAQTFDNVAMPGGKDKIDYYKQSKFESLKQSLSQFGSNIALSGKIFLGIGEGRDLGIQEAWTGQRNILKPFEYSSEIEAEREIKNPFYIPSSTRGTITATPSIEQREWITKGELYDSPIISTAEIDGQKYIVSTPRISEYEVMGRQFNAGRVSTGIGTATAIGASILVPPVGFIFAAEGAYKNIGAAFKQDATIGERIFSGAVGGISLAAAGLFAGKTFEITSAQLRSLTAENLRLQSTKAPAVGTGRVEGQLVRVDYGKRITTELGKLEIAGRTYTVGADSKLVTVGRQLGRMEVYDWYTGNTFTGSELSTFSFRGAMAEGMAGKTVTLGTRETLREFTIKTIPGKITTFRTELIPGGFKTKSAIIAGESWQRGRYVLSRAGELKRVDINILESGNQDVAFGADLTERAIIKFGEPGAGVDFIGTKLIQKGTPSIIKGYSQGSVQSIIQTLKMPSVTPPTTAGVITTTSRTGINVLAGLSTGLSSGILKQETIIKPVVFSASDVKLDMQQKSLGGQIFGSGFATGVINIPVSRDITTPIVTTGTITTPRETPTLRLIQPTITTPSTPASPTFTPMPKLTGVPPAFPWEFPFRGERGSRLGNLKASRKYSYFPSFKAIAFGIKGKMPKVKRFTGLETRPVTKGFGLKKIKFGRFKF